MHAFVQPLLQAAGIIIQRNGLCNTTVVKAQLTGQIFDNTCMVGGVYIYVFIPDFWNYSVKNSILLGAINPKYSTMKASLILLMLLSLCAAKPAAAQKNAPPIKYGAITEKDFTIGQPLDSGTAAVVIADIGSSSFDGNSKGWFSLVFKHFTRVKILNKNGFSAADVVIPLYIRGTAEERVSDLKGHTYNLENGQLVETKLDGGSVFKDKLDKNHIFKKFTLPAVKEGSIIEYTYTVTSDFLFNLQPWEFQGKYPCLWSEYNVKIPQFFDYVVLKQGYLPYFAEETKSNFQHFNITSSADNPTGPTESYNINSNVVDARWVIKEAPALKEEKFTSTIENHLSKVSFQLSGYREPLTPKRIMGSWFTLAEELLKDEDFGDGLGKSNGWLDNDLKSICAGAATPLERARKIYAYIRDNFTCTSHNSKYLSASSKQTFSKRNGNDADINLLLVTMLRHEGMNSDPILLSTREHGFTYETYPIIDRFNYVICRLVIDDKKYYLDASHDYLGFNKLAEDCYNGHARVINSQLPETVYFIPDSLTEKKMTSVFIAASEKDKTKMEGNFQSMLGYFESASVRDRIKEKGKDEFFKKVKSAYGFDIDIQNPAVDSMQEKDKPLVENYTFTFDKPSEGMLYINPMMCEGIKENYFKAAQRNYPVEMPYAMDETYVFNMEVPEGYTVDELPKSARVSFNDTDGMFEYLVDKSEDHIRLMSHIKLNKATFQPEEYDSLRQFFGYIVKKHAEQVVLKKKG